MNKSVLGLFTFLCVLSSPLYAEETGRTSAGTVVVAAMESVGYHAQNQILANLNTMLGDIGALIYLGVIVSAVLTVGLMGRYQAALWLLIGPSIFIYVSGVEIGGLKNRIMAQGPEWQLGPFKGPEGMKEKVMGRQDPPTDVSFVFHKYNELISEIYQLLIQKITSQDAKKAILFMARQRMMEGLFSLDLTTPGGKALGAFFFEHCAHQLAYARHFGQGQRNPAYRQTNDYITSKEKYCTTFDVKDINLGMENLNLADYARELTPPYEDGMVSCLQVWNWFRQSATRDFAAQSEALMNNVIGPEAATTEGAAATSKMVNDVKDKLTTPPENAAAPDADICPFPSDSAEKAIGGGENSEAFKVLGNIFSALMIRKNATVDSNSTSFMALLGGDASGVVPSSDASSIRRAVNLQGQDSLIRDQNAKTMGKAKQFEAFTMLMLIPYFQGMILYVLSVTYPFFALSILVPGQAGSFFNWMALWAWAKSWDVGFAMVMVVDQLLWEILPKTTFYEPGAVGENTPIQLLSMHYSGDMSYSISMYWLIVSALIGAVPFVTAEAILGSKKAFAGAIMGGFSEISGRLSKAVESYESTGNVTEVTAGRTKGEFHALKGNMGTGHAALTELGNSKDGSDSSDSYKHNVNQAVGLGRAAQNAAEKLTGQEVKNPGVLGEQNKEAAEAAAGNRKADGVP